MAHVEAVSKLMIVSYKQEEIDIRKVRLPRFDQSESSIKFDPSVSSSVRFENEPGAELDSKVPQKKYDPREHKLPGPKIKLWMAYFNLLRTMMGPAMMGMPLAVSQMGILFGPIITMSTGFLIVYTHGILLDSLYEISRRLRIPYIPYRYGFRIAVLHGPHFLHCIGHLGPKIVATFMFVSQLGICTVTIIFTTDSLRDVLDLEDTKYPHLILIFPYLFMEYFMKNMLIVSYVSMIGNFMNLTAMSLMFKYVVIDPHGEVTIHTNLMGILFGFGSLLFNLSSVGVILSVEKSLENRKAMRGLYGVLSVGIICPTIIATIFGVMGYFAFGTMDENILRSLPFDEALAVSAISIYSISVIFAYPIHCYPAITTVVELIKYHYDPDEAPSVKTQDLIKAITRPLFVVTSFLISYWIPFQGSFVALVGNLCTTMLALAFPALMDMCLRYPHEYGKKNYRLYIDLCVIGLGLTSLVFGVYLCGHLIYIRILTMNDVNYSRFF